MEAQVVVRSVCLHSSGDCFVVVVRSAEADECAVAEAVAAADLSVALGA